MTRARILPVCSLLLGVALALSGCFSSSTPIAFLGSTRVSGSAPLDVSFNLSYSEHSRGRPMTYHLDFGDGSEPAVGEDLGLAVHHTYALGGTYVATLTLTDEEGATDIDQLTITVSQDGPPEGIVVGATAPDFTAPTTDGGQVVLSELRGHVVLLDFWGAWCPPCRKSMPRLDALAATYAPDGLVVVVISTDPTAEDSVEYLEDNGYDRFISVWEPGGKYTPLALHFGVLGGTSVGIPHTILIDKQGVIRFRGHPTTDLTEAMVEALL